MSYRSCGILYVNLEVPPLLVLYSLVKTCTEFNRPTEQTNPNKQYNDNYVTLLKATLSFGLDFQCLFSINNNASSSSDVST